VARVSSDRRLTLSSATPRPDPRRCRIDGVISVLWTNIIIFGVMLAVVIVACVLAVSYARRHI
jgi:hypothetical protein